MNRDIAAITLVVIVLLLSIFQMMQISSISGQTTNAISAYAQRGSGNLVGGTAGQAPESAQISRSPQSQASGIPAMVGGC